MLATMPHAGVRFLLALKYLIFFLNYNTFVFLVICTLFGLTFNLRIVLEVDWQSISVKLTALLWYRRIVLEVDRQSISVKLTALLWYRPTEVCTKKRQNDRTDNGSVYAG